MPPASASRQQHTACRRHTRNIGDRAPYHRYCPTSASRALASRGFGWGAATLTPPWPSARSWGSRRWFLLSGSLTTPAPRGGMPWSSLGVRRHHAPWDAEGGAPVGLTPVVLRLRAWWAAGSPAWRLGGWRNPDPSVRAGVAAGMSSGHLTSQLNQCRGGVAPVASTPPRATLGPAAAATTTPEKRRRITRKHAVALSVCRPGERWPYVAAGSAPRSRRVSPCRWRRRAPGVRRSPGTSSMAGTLSLSPRHTGLAWGGL